MPVMSLNLLWPFTSLTELRHMTYMVPALSAPFSPKHSISLSAMQATLADIPSEGHLQCVALLSNSIREREKTLRWQIQHFQILKLSWEEKNSSREVYKLHLTKSAHSPSTHLHQGRVDPSLMIVVDILDCIIFWLALQSSPLPSPSMSTVALEVLAAVPSVSNIISALTVLG